MTSSGKFGRKPAISNLYVAAIDFGTTYSGYAFSIKSEWETIRTNKWIGGTLMSHKAPTVVLLNADQSFNSFGYEAENEYGTLSKSSDKAYKDYYYFQNFKMKLHNSKNVTEGSIIEDITGKAMLAIDVFAHAIRKLKENLMEELRNAISDTKDDDVLFVLTVPAIWDERAKLFMRKAAVKAGIKPHLLKIALEPEAASVFCQTLPFNVEDVGQSSLVKPGVRYMVADLGGGTADLTIHQRTDNGKLQELWRASGGPWGGKAVNDNFLNFITEIVGEKSISALLSEEMDDYLDLLRDFEIQKRQVKAENASITINMPVSINDIIKEKSNFENFESALKASKYSGKVSFRKMKITIPESIASKFFKPVIDETLLKMKSVFDHVQTDIPYILLVGGFSECSIVQREMRQTFASKTIIAPHDAGLIVLKGAVYFGYLPESISVRCAPYTYGIQSWPLFDSSIHPRSKRVVINNEERCKDVFFKFVTIGDKIEAGFKKSQHFQILDPSQDVLECNVFISEKENPVLIDECTPLLKLKVPLKNISNRSDVEMEEALVFGETELRVIASDKHGHEFSVSKEL